MYVSYNLSFIRRVKVLWKWMKHLGYEGVFLIMIATQMAIGFGGGWWGSWAYGIPFEKDMILRRACQLSRNKLGFHGAVSVGARGNTERLSWPSVWSFFVFFFIKRKLFVSQPNRSFYVYTCKFSIFRTRVQVLVLLLRYRATVVALANIRWRPRVQLGYDMT